MKASRLLAAALAAALAGCGAAPFDYRSPSDMPSGPGMLSGKDGEFVFRFDKATPAAASGEAEEIAE